MGWFAGLAFLAHAKTVAAYVLARSVAAMRRMVRSRICRGLRLNEMAGYKSNDVHPDGKEARPPDLHTQLEDLFDEIWKLERWEAHVQKAVDES